MLQGKKVILMQNFVPSVIKYCGGQMAICAIAVVICGMVSIEQVDCEKYIIHYTWAWKT